MHRTPVGIVIFDDIERRERTSALYRMDTGGDQQNG